MRTNNSIKNSLSSFFSYFLVILITFISQRIIINYLGIEYLGLNSVLKNLFSMFNILEFGIGTVILYYLYSSINNKDINQIKSIMNYTKKYYYFVMFLVFIVGLLFIPFLKIIVKDNLDLNIYIVYLLYLLLTILIYLFEYKNCIIIAYQKKYIVTLIHTIYIFLTNIVQIIILFNTKNYYLFLLINILTLIFERIAISIYFSKKYYFLIDKNKYSLHEKLKNEISKKLRAYTIDKIATILVYNTDAILVSYFYGLKNAGIYSNYLIITNGVDALFNGIISSLTPSVGDLVVNNQTLKNYEIYKKIRFLNLTLAIFTTIFIVSLSQDFISIWFGKKYLFDFKILIVLGFLFYVNFMKYTFKVFKHGAGIWLEDKYVPIFNSLLNIISSIIFLKIFGLIGIFMGTIFSSIPLWFYDFPLFIYKKLFNRKLIDYYREMFVDSIISSIIIIPICIILNLITFDNLFINLLFKFIIGIILLLIIFMIFFRKKEEYQYFKNLIKRRKI